MQRVRQKVTKYYHQIEEFKTEKAQLQEKLSVVYEQIRKEREEKNIITRDPADIQKIHELKSFIRELLDELKRKEELIKELKPKEEAETKPKEEIILDELDEENSSDETNLESLTGKTVAIIGGQRQEQAEQKEYPCNVLTHSGERIDNEFYNVVKNSDIIIILTQFISHAAMWEAKAYAVKENVPIYYRKGLNIPKLLKSIF